MEDYIYDKIVELSRIGDSFVDSGRFDAAIEKYEAAVNLLPEPVEQWEATGWLYAAIGDAYMFKKNYEKALNWFFDAQNVSDVGNPFLLLRIGECSFEINDIEKAKSCLLQAYMLEGERIFEDEPAKYFNVIKDIV